MALVMSLLEINLFPKKKFFFKIFKSSLERQSYNPLGALPNYFYSLSRKKTPKPQSNPLNSSLSSQKKEEIKLSRLSQKFQNPPPLKKTEELIKTPKQLHKLLSPGSSKNCLKCHSSSSHRNCALQDTLSNQNWTKFREKVPKNAFLGAFPVKKFL